MIKACNCGVSIQIPRCNPEAVQELNKRRKPQRYYLIAVTLRRDQQRRDIYTRSIQLKRGRWADSSFVIIDLVGKEVYKVRCMIRTILVYEHIASCALFVGLLGRTTPASDPDRVTTAVTPLEGQE